MTSPRHFASWPPLKPCVWGPTGPSAPTSITELWNCGTTEEDHRASGGLEVLMEDGTVALEGLFKFTK